jgi:biopolymer transport protein ExbB/TolQ
MALTTTILGLSIAIPALAFNSYLNRRVETYEAQLEVGVERLVAEKKKAGKRA